MDKRLQYLLQRLMAQPGVQHAIMAVESADRSVRWVGCAGDANPDGTPMRADTPFFIASVTKLYIATAIMKLHERGRLGLDESISAYLSPTLIGGLHRLGGEEHTDTITVRHLLGHTSGLPDYIEERPKGGRALVERLVSEGDMACGIDEVVRIVRQLTPHFPPQPKNARRKKARYSDTNYRLLIAIIELAIELGAHLITLEVRASNTEAQKLYAKYGFVRVGLRRGYYTDNREDAVLMTIEDVKSAQVKKKLERLKRAHSEEMKRLLTKREL